jgi:hypothetical protein
MLKTFALLIFFFPFTCVAQVAVSGKVLNQADHKPIANASVFISNGSIGDKTNNDGTFTLKNLKPGKYDLVVSIIGYETYSQPLPVSDANSNLPDILLVQKTMQLQEVKVKVVSDKNRPLYLDWLKQELLGNSEIAKQCKIVNPEMLDFDFQQNTLKASSVDFLIIENITLGYKVKYLLTDFSLNNPRGIERKLSYKGFTLFEEMEGTPAQQASWRKARQEVYANSSMHFFRAVADNRITEEGFKMQQLAENPNPDRPANELIAAKVKHFAEANPKTSAIRDSLNFWTKKSQLPKTQLSINDYPLSINDVLKNTEQKGLYAIGCDNDAILVNYNKAHRFSKAKITDLSDRYNNSISVIEFNKLYAFFNNSGWITNIDDIMLAGVWAKKRVAELLPEDYEDAMHTKVEKADSTLTGIITKTESFSSNHVAEKSYLHLDRFNYLPGDTIWFKAYVVAGAAHELSSLSGVLHVELINQKDSVIRRLNLPLDDGLATGDFTLSRSLSTGVYRIRAYTNWMRNDNNYGFFEQQIQVGPQVINFTTTQQALAKNPDVQFFPEGGELINGLRSKVAIKAINVNGLGENVKGSITDNDGNEVAEFETQHLGMGVFALSPQTGKAYKAKITTQSGATFTVDLPKAHNDGFVLTVNNRRADSISVKISTVGNIFAAKQHTGYYLIGQSAGTVYYTTSFKLDNPAYIVNIDKQRFPSGIVQFTLFAQNAEPLNERIAFIRVSDTLKLNITTPDKRFATRQKMQLNLDATDDAGSKTQGSFSVSVINETRTGSNENAESTILSNLLLTSDLKGNIEMPNYYFNKVTDQTEADLDVLMLTQGYRHFDWKQILADKPTPLAYEPEKGLELNGTLKTPGGKILANGKVNLYSNKEGVFADTVTDVNGNFKFRNFELSDTAKVVVQARKQNDGKNVSIFIKQQDYPAVNKLATVNNNEEIANLSPEQKIVLQEKYTTYVKQQKIDSLNKINTLKEVVIKGKKTTPEYIKNKFGAVEQKQLDMAKLRGPQFTSLQDAIFWVAPETHILETGSYYNKTRSKGQSRNADSIPDGSVIIDGAVRNRELLNAYSAQEIENVNLVYLDPKSYTPTIFVRTRRAAGTDTTTLKEVKVRSTRLAKKPDLSFSSNLNGAGHADEVFMGNKLNGCSRLADCLRGRLMGVSFDGNGNPVNTRNNKEMSVIINGNILSGDALNNLNSNDIYSIEVLRSGGTMAIYGSNLGQGGALVITTNQGTTGFVTSESPSGVITYPYKGFYKARNFYSPKYANTNTGTSLPDLRTTIYWEPNLVTDNAGAASFSYFNADTKGTYRITIEGINGAGKLGRKIFRYKIE